MLLIEGMNSRKGERTFALTEVPGVSNHAYTQQRQNNISNFLSKRPTVYIHLAEAAKPWLDPPKSPLKRGTSDPVPSFLRRVREDQAQDWLDQMTCVYTVAPNAGRHTVCMSLFLDQASFGSGIGKEIYVSKDLLKNWETLDEEIGLSPG